MKEDEKVFFRICIWYRIKRDILILDIINILHECGYMHYKRARYLLMKWADIGFYEYGVSLELGWFRLDELPKRYKVLLEETEI